MFSRKKKNMGVKSAEEEETEIASAGSQISHSQMSQIYLQQWEKENLKRKLSKKPPKKTVKEIFKQDNKKKEQKKPLEDKKSKEDKQVKFKKDKKINEDSEARNIEDLIAKNNELKENLDHSRRVCRELVMKLNNERARKRFKKEDFEMIQSVLKRYI